MSVEPRRYQPVKDEDGFNPHVKRHVKIWGLFCLVAVPICVYLLDWSMYLDPIDPTMNQIRFAVIKISACVIGFLGLSGYVIYKEVVTNGNLLGIAMSTPDSASRVLSAIIYAGAAIMVFM